jgi:hypothetical protein
MDTYEEAVKHFRRVRDEWFFAFSQIRLYLHNLDGDTSRAVGKLIQSIIDGEKTGETDASDWPTVSAAKFIHSDPDLWHEVADSRKQEARAVPDGRTY